MKPKFGRNPSFLMTLFWRAEFLVLLFFRLFLLFMPWKTRIAFGKFLGRLLYRFDKKHRKVSLENLSGAFPGLDKEKIAGLSRKSFENIGRLIIEVIFQRSKETEIFAETNIEGWQHLQEVSREGKGYILVSGHFGNWEWVAYLQSSLGFPVEMVTRPLDNPYAENFLRKIRESKGNKVIYKRNAVREMVRALKASKGVAFVFDQNFGEEGGVFVPFFGRPAATTPVFGRIAARMNVPVLPVMAYPDGNGYRVRYEKPIFPKNDLTIEENSLMIIGESTSILEHAVGKTPWAWFWMHDRWRTRPEDSAEKKNES
jgi:Kdo2-lipid IVA lauroyltransferase/acyltransferase